MSARAGKGGKKNQEGCQEANMLKVSTSGGGHQQLPRNPAKLAGGLEPKKNPSLPKHLGEWISVFRGLGLFSERVSPGPSWLSPSLGR